MFPAVSVARTVKECEPNTGAGTMYGDVHAARGEPSTLHANVAGSFAANAKLTAPETTERLAGPDVIFVIGGWLSFGPFPLPASAAAGATRPRTSSASTTTALAFR